ncbi:hypothetical protein JD844_019861 [Phrynosoma platyrhinos]|uniref:Peroxin/Ferlin domain-containing protein n=1 Tax=Phrynosoma platyrhinos TaxID=52577 RepID=A0ABQ7TQ64_PHRPL|nr:hypothetical protein JD844_019861 [Phrynosoma platyrhinos]
MATSNSLLWAVDIFGRVYTLSTTGQYWELCKDGELEFKRVSAVKQCCWGIACDHQVYVYVHSNDVRIRYQEETYENQLLPSDRWQWSDVSGLKHQKLESFVLPSPHWEWESDWYVDENFGGDPTEKGIWYREDVCYHNPEGSSWTLVATPGEAVQISCGPYDLVWATLWEGQAIVRHGIDRNNPHGKSSFWSQKRLSWTVVESPVQDNGILHISVGVNVVWAVTKDRKVWFRRGVNSHNPCGTSWIEMVGEMMMVNVGLNDQGVTPSELSGKTWKVIACSRDSDRSQTGSSTSLLR